MLDVNTVHLAIHRVTFYLLGGCRALPCSESTRYLKPLWFWWTLVVPHESAKPPETDKGDIGVFGSHSSAPPPCHPCQCPLSPQSASKSQTLLASWLLDSSPVNVTSWHVNCEKRGLSLESRPLRNIPGFPNSPEFSLIVNKLTLYHYEYVPG